MDEGAQAIGPNRGRSALILYCLAVAITPFVIIIAGFFIVQTSWFVAKDRNTFIANLGYGLKLTNSDCRIVIYGDSTALAGLDPDLIGKQTGLPTCNISETAGVTSVNGMDVLDVFLRRNPRPRVIVLDFAEDDFPPNWKASLTEGILLRLRERPVADTVGILLRHPEDTLRFATLGAREALMSLNNKRLPASAYSIRREHRGYLPIPGEPLTECSKSGTDRQGRDHGVDRSWVASLRSRYAGGNTIVLVTVTPENRCDVNSAAYAALPPWTDNRPTMYPLEYFNGSGHLHMTRPGAIRFSNEMAALINAKLAQSGPVTQGAR